MSPRRGRRPHPAVPAPAPGRPRRSFRRAAAACPADADCSGFPPPPPRPSRSSTIPEFCRSSEVTHSTPVFRPRSSSWNTSWMCSSLSGPSIAMISPAVRRRCAGDRGPSARGSAPARRTVPRGRSAIPGPTRPRRPRSGACAPARRRNGRALPDARD